LLCGVAGCQIFLAIFVKIDILKVIELCVIEFETHSVYGLERR